MSETSSEQWRPVVGYEDLYEVSDHGRIRSLDRIVVDKTMGSARTRRIPGRILKPYPVGKRWGDTRKYLAVRLCRAGATEPATLHLLVATAFHGPRPHGLIVLHGNDDGHDNRALNLRYGTYAENSQDAIRNGAAPLQRHCVNGHDRTPENMDGSRQCLPCRESRRSGHGAA